MFKDINKFLEKNSSVILASVIFNAFFLLTIVFFLNSVFGVSVLMPSEVQDKEKVSNKLEYKENEEQTVIDVVSVANPAVVSIVATAHLPEISKEDRGLFEYFMPYLNLDLPGGTREQQVGGGTGFFVSSDGLIATNRHVVENESLDFAVLTSDGEKYPAKVVAKDPIYDVAILKVEIENAAFLEFGNSDNLVLGESVIAIGNALAEFSNSVTKGVVSGLSRSIQARGRGGQAEFLENVIQTDASIHPGNSGGPLLNLKGEVIGINVAVALGTDNIGFALPSNLVERIVRSVKEEGRIVRPFIGVRYYELNELIANEYDLPVSEGAWVHTDNPTLGPAVVPESPAHKAGVKEGDVIVEFGGKTINNKTSLQKVIRDMEVGESTSLVVLRNGERIKLEVELEEAPSDLR